MSHVHFGGSYYGCIDGSVAFYIEPPGGCSLNWQAEARRGNWVSIGQWPVFWGWWNRQ